MTTALRDHVWNARQALRHGINTVTGQALNRRRIRTTLGYDVNLRDPQSFNEKVLWRMRFDRRPELITYCDKLATRDWVRQRLGSARAEPLLTDLIHATADPADLATCPLGGGVVVKSNHGSGRVIILGESDPVDRAALQAAGARWLRRGFGYGRGEWAYSRVPRRIMVERLLPNDTGQPASDVKFYVFDGRTHYVRVVIDRFGPSQRMALGRDGRRHAIVKPNDVPRTVQPHIPGFDRMSALAEELCDGLDFLRVDFLWNTETFRLNEVTAYPMAAALTIGGKANDLWLGSHWTLPALASVRRPG